MNTSNTFARLLAAAGIAIAAGAVTPSLAARPHIPNPVQTHHGRAYNAHASATPRFERNQRNGGGWFAHGEVDDPPGSSFQDYGFDQSLGMVR